MSALPGKVQVLGVVSINSQKYISLQFLQARDTKWVGRPFFAEYDAEAVWLDDLKPAFGEKKFFFEDDLALANFRRGNYELGAQASAVAVTAGASVDADFNEGVAIFTIAKGGLMYEASVGGQKFKIEEKE